MYTMVNSLQVITAMGLLSNTLSANVYYLLSEVQKLAGFELLPPDNFIQFLVPSLTDTQPVNDGFLEMGYDGATLIPNLGFFFVGMIFVLVKFLAAYFLTWFTLCSRNPTLNRLHQRLLHDLCFGDIIVLVLEGFLDFSIGCGANLEQLKWVTTDDFLNNILVILLSAVVLCFAPVCLVFLKKNLSRQHIFLPKYQNFWY